MNTSRGGILPHVTFATNSSLCPDYAVRHTVRVPDRVALLRAARQDRPHPKRAAQPLRDFCARWIRAARPPTPAKSRVSVVVEVSSSSASRGRRKNRHTRAPPSFGVARPPLTARALQVQPWATHNLVATWVQWAPTGGHQSEPWRRRWVDADTGRVPASLLWDLESAAAKREQMCAAPRRATARPACAPPLRQPHEHCTARIFGPRANFSAGQLPNGFARGRRTRRARNLEIRNFHPDLDSRLPQRLPNAPASAAGMASAARHASLADGARPRERRGLARRSPRPAQARSRAATLLGTGAWAGTA